MCADGLQASWHPVVLGASRHGAQTVVDLVANRLVAVEAPALIAAYAAWAARQTPQTATLSTKSIRVGEANVQERIDAPVYQLQYEQGYFDGKVKTLFPQVLLEVHVPKHNASVDFVG